MVSSIKCESRMRGLSSAFDTVFREQAIDGSSLPLLTEDHLVTRMGLKLGPALKFRAVLSKKIGHCPVCTHCVHCHEGSKDTANDSRASYSPTTDGVVTQQGTCDGQYL
ncbi:unnamed protein product [Cyprideis torosa]|uniref:Uncharacterized protein n=1 Tax=Cyprideis torosa TaxID=163714 RepID=A0A7R8ZQ78_9CRUS|nr:unnamed protein product [Cyprideis torosa]CAG0900733.1 unnamed protein product [Cyprideis torosa]